MEFTEGQIQQHLALLGYSNIPEHRLQEFKKDLEELINHERSKSNSTTSYSPESVESKASSNHVSQARIQSTCQLVAATQNTQRAFSSEIENQAALPSHGRGFLHCQPGGYYQSDSYIRSSVAPKPNQYRCNSAPCTLILHNSPDQESNNSEGQSDNSPEGLCGSKRKPTLRRKVLRKKNGEVQVCDESVTSEIDWGKYNGLDICHRVGGEEDEDLSSSFWSDQSSHEDSEQSAVNDQSSRPMASITGTSFPGSLPENNAVIESEDSKDMIKSDSPHSIIQKPLFELHSGRSDMLFNGTDHHCSSGKNESSCSTSVTDLFNRQQEKVDSVSELGQRISRFQTQYDEAESDEESEESRTIDSCIITHRRPGSAQTYFTRDMWSHMPTGNESSNVSCGPKSFIRPIMDHPHTRNLKKSDPVTKYFEYKREWDTFKIPGEKDQKQLRWGIRQQMLYKSHLPPKPQRMYIPNDYIVPTDKKRSALRWGIRHDMANGTIPHKFLYPL